MVSKERPRYRGLMHAFTNIVKNDGLRGLYRVSDIWNIHVYVNIIGSVVTCIYICTCNSL